jgi:hypothetical protein
LVRLEQLDRQPDQVVEADLPVVLHLEVRGEPGSLVLLAENPQAEGVERGNGDGLDAVRQQAPQALPHLVGRPSGKGDRETDLRAHTAGRHELRDAMSEGTRLARAWAGNDEQRARPVRDGRSLVRIQPAKAGDASAVDGRRLIRVEHSVVGAGGLEDSLLGSAGYAEASSGTFDRRPQVRLEQQEAGIGCGAVSWGHRRGDCQTLGPARDGRLRWCGRHLGQLEEAIVCRFAVLEDTDHAVLAVIARLADNAAAAQPL